jgi:hypothetical protein
MRKRYAALLVGLGALVVVLGVTALASAAAGHRRVQMLDACDGPTFNAAIGEGTCVRNGGVTFERFIGQLIAKGEAIRAGAAEARRWWDDHSREPRG